MRQPRQLSKVLALLRARNRGLPERRARAHRYTSLELVSQASHNGEAIYATRPWTTFGDAADKATGTPSVRFTRSKDKTTLYAILCDWKSGEILLKSVTKKSLPAERIKSIQLLGTDKPLKWAMKEDGLAIQMPSAKPGYDYAFPIRIQLNQPMRLAN